MSFRAIPWCLCARGRAWWALVDLCDALDGCFSALHQTHAGVKKPKGKWAPWRTLAAKDYIKKTEDVSPNDNNYDGRNFITEL